MMICSYCSALAQGQSLFDNEDLRQDGYATLKQNSIQSIKKDIKKTSQSGFGISSGVGAPDCINLKIKYGGRFQIGAGAGLLPENITVSRGRSVTLNFDFYINFVRSKKTSRFKFYFNSGISKIFPVIDYNENKTGIIFYSRLGRTFNFNQRIGIDFDLGLMLAHNTGSVYYSPMYTARYGHPVKKYDYNSYDPYPSFNLSFFVRL